jgi:hypothetical protein
MVPTIKRKIYSSYVQNLLLSLLSIAIKTDFVSFDLDS